MKIRKTLGRAADRLVQDAVDVGFRPYLPRQSTMHALTTFYSVLAGIFYGDAYAHFVGQGFFARLDLASIIAISFTFIFSAILLIMLWIEIESNIRNQMLFGENQKQAPKDIRPAISYIRTVVAFLCMFLFSLAPLQIATVSSSLSLSTTSIDFTKEANALASFYGYVVLALGSLTFWRLVLLVSSFNRKAAQYSISAKTIKTGPQIPLSCSLAFAYAYSGTTTIATKGLAFAVVFPFLLFVGWFGLTWLIVHGVETKQLSHRRAALITLATTALVFVIYTYIFA